MSLNIDTQSKIQLEVANLVGKRAAVLGSSGFGKTTTNVVLIEELLKAKLPLTVVDIEGEYWGLKSSFEIVVVAGAPSPHSDIVLRDGSQAAALARLAFEQRFPVILDLSEFTEAEAGEILHAYLVELWQQAGKNKQPYQLIVDEIHEFIPQGRQSPLAEIMVRIAKRGRKRGIGVIFSTQRATDVSKSFLTQAEIFFLHKVIYPNDLRIYRELLPDDLASSGKEADQLIKSLVPGECYFLRGETNERVKVRRRETFDSSATPELAADQADRLIKIDTAAILAALAKAETAKPEPAQEEETKPATSSRSSSGKSRVAPQAVAPAAPVVAASDSAAEIAKLSKELEAATAEIKRLEAALLQAREAAQEKPKQLAAQVSVAKKQAVPEPEQKPASKQQQLALFEQPEQPQLSPPTKETVLSTQLVRSRLSEFEQNKLKMLVEALKRLSPKEKQILSLLLEHEEREPNRTFAPLEIRRATGIDTSHFSRDFKDLFKIVFVEYRPGSGVRTRLTTDRGRVRSFVSDGFPGVNPTLVVQPIRAALG